MEWTSFGGLLGEGNSPFKIILFPLDLLNCGIEEIKALVYGCLGFYKVPYYLQFLPYDLSTLRLSHH